MAFTDLISSSFLFSIAIIIIILIGAIFANYVSYRMSEQDHKISSMLGLVTTMAEEMQFFRNKLSKIPEQEHHDNNSQSLFDPNNLLHIGAIHANNLISVSDDENDENDDESCSDEDDSETSSDDDCETGSDDDCETGSNDDDDDESGSDEDEKTNLDTLIVEEFDLEQNTEFLNITSINNQPEEHNIKMIHLKEIVDVSENEVHNHNSLDNIFSGDLKTISIFDLEESNKKTNDYKKMSLNKLRDIVIEKGLVSDASKLKKNELVKLLEDE